MGLFLKLSKLQSSVRGLEKDASAGSGNNAYPYVSGSKVLGFIRPEMDKLGLILVQQIDHIENERIDYQTQKGSKSEMLTKVMMTFTWIDSESGETLPVKFGANGMNNWDKGLGSALTYAERYFLLKFFHIPTDEDDVDALPSRGNEDPIPAPAPKQKKVMDQNHKGWQKMCDAVAAGEYTIQQIAEMYDLPLYAEAALKDYVLSKQE